MANNPERTRTLFNDRARDEPIPRAALPVVLVAIGQPHELDAPFEVIAYQKRYDFDCAPEDRIAWVELERWLTSARPGRTPIQ
jgi:hypothetical protein